MLFIFPEGTSDMRVTFWVFALCLFIPQFEMGQAGPTEITNSDVISMTKRSYWLFSADQRNSTRLPKR